MTRNRGTKASRLTRRQVNVTGEAQYVAGRAARRETCIVTLGPLLFFSTDTGDAWVLDPEDQLARCLAREGELLPSGITETPERFAIEWNATYQLQGDLMMVTDGTGRTRVVAGYPVAEIRRALSAAGSRRGPSRG